MSSNSQNVNINNVKARDIKVKQSLRSGVDIPKPQNKGDLLFAISQLITELQKISNEDPDIKDAILELTAALQETKKSKPESSKIKRFLNSAKGVLVDVSDSVGAISTITTTITMLIGTLKTIFGG